MLEGPFPNKTDQKSHFPYQKMMVFFPEVEWRKFSSQLFCGLFLKLLCMSLSAKDFKVCHRWFSFVINCQVLGGGSELSWRNMGSKAALIKAVFWNLSASCLNWFSSASILKVEGKKKKKELHPREHQRVWSYFHCWYKNEEHAKTKLHEGC